MQALFYSFIFYPLIASGSMVFSAVSMFAFSFEADDGTDDSVGVGRERNDYTLR